RRFVEDCVDRVRRLDAGRYAAHRTIARSDRNVDFSHRFESLRPRPRHYVDDPRSRSDTEQCKQPRPPKLRMAPKLPVRYVKESAEIAVMTANRQRRVHHEQIQTVVTRVDEDVCVAECRCETPGATRIHLNDRYVTRQPRGNGPCRPEVPIGDHDLD